MTSRSQLDEDGYVFKRWLTSASCSQIRTRVHVCMFAPSSSRNGSWTTFESHKPVVDGQASSEQRETGLKFALPHQCTHVQLELGHASLELGHMHRVLAVAQL